MCGHDLTGSKCKGKRDIIEPLPVAVFGPLVYNFLWVVLWAACLLPVPHLGGEPHCVSVTCAMKEGPSGVSPA